MRLPWALPAFASRRYRAGPAPGSVRRRAGGDIPAGGAHATPVFRWYKTGLQDRPADTRAATRHARSTAAYPAGLAAASYRAERPPALRAPLRHGLSICAPRRAALRRNRA